MASYWEYFRWKAARVNLPRKIGGAFLFSPTPPPSQSIMLGCIKMQDLTIIDELTGLFNYRYFKNKLSDEMRRAERYNQPMGLLMIDIDHFKKLNDTQGHQTGNIILQELASVLKQAVRDVDIVARYGGEEFMVILPQTDLSKAQIIAERIRSSS
jgi:diguanylate cyclase (GGDEF)-like protein